MTSLPGESYDVAFGIRVAAVLTSDARLRRATRSSLEEIGLRVRELGTFAELEALRDRGRLDLVLYDVRERLEDEGRSIARELRHPGYPPHLGVLVLSPTSEIPEALEALEQGADDVLTVPFHHVIFGARVKAALNRAILYEKYRLGIEALRESRHELATAIESMSYGFALFGRDGALRLGNQRFFAMYPPATPASGELTLPSLFHAVASVEEEGSAEKERRVAECVEALREGRPRLIRTREGRVLEIRGSRTPNGGLVTAHEDVTERVRDEERLRHLALHDPLTGLSNRAQFEDVLERMLHGARRGDHCFALLYVDLDGFKRVNDRLGHGAGDQLLLQVATILKETVREADLVARLGGDEFAILSPNTRSREEVERIGERLRSRLGDRFPASPRGVPIGLSIGAVILTPPGDHELDAKTLVAHADAAMYAAKRAGAGRVVFHGGAAAPADQSNLGGRFS